MGGEAAVGRYRIGLMAAGMTPARPCAGHQEKIFRFVMAVTSAGSPDHYPGAVIETLRTRRRTVFTLIETHFETLKTAAVAAALLASLTTMSAPAVAGDEVYQPIQAISQTVGSKHVAGYFLNPNGQCQVTLMVEEVWDPDGDTSDFTASRLRFELQPNQTAAVDTAENESISLTCGDKAETLALARPNKFYALNVE
jgi:hypothetical protein